MTTLKLNKGFSEIDEEDFLRASKINWHLTHGRYAFNSNAGFLHHFVLGTRPDPTLKMTVDHIDGNGLNNKKNNLRLVPQWVNLLNRHKLSASNTSGVTGVTFDRKSGKWEAFTHIKNRKRHIGLFVSKKAATDARKAFIERLLADPNLRELPYLGLRNTSGFVGVSFWQRGLRWKAKFKGKHLGYFSLKEDAIKAWQTENDKYWSMKPSEKL